SYREAHGLVDDKGMRLVEHPVACLDCHDPKTMAPRVTRPAFIAGIRALKAKDGVRDYDPNRDATRQEMRSFVCGQCHVEYYFRGPNKVVTYPWASGLRVEEIEQYYDREGFTDWVHAETGNKVLKAQHPEFEVWSQGVHARAGVACADCHMPYERVGAAKVSDHGVRSPLLNVNRACQSCHAVPEDELRARVLTIQDRHYALLQRAAKATTDMLDAIVLAKNAGATEAGLKEAAALHGRRSGGSITWRPRTAWGRRGDGAGHRPDLLGWKRLGAVPAAVHPTAAPTRANGNAGGRRWRRGLLLLVAVGLLHALGVIDLLSVEGLARGVMWLILLAAVAFFANVLTSRDYSAIEKRRVGSLAFLFVFSGIFWAGSEQAGSSLNIFAEKSVDLTMLGVAVPASMLQSTLPLLLLALAPLFTWLWPALARAGREPSTPVKFAIGLICMGLSFAVLVPATRWLRAGRS
ncbi:MAG: ammonia-forming cytochrome c nitrite reductase subunit c552, partial [Candidatus Rokuibacteriota bacterium]